MATLYVENIPDELYEALRKRAKERRKSIAAEIVTLLQDNIPTSVELKRRRQFYEKLKKFRADVSPGQGSLPSSSEIQREDRER